jgi:hypothetical protein
MIFGWYLDIVLKITFKHLFFKILDFLTSYFLVWKIQLSHVPRYKDGYWENNKGKFG